MVVTLKDGTVVTLFDVTETKEIIGDELFEFIKHEYTKEDDRDDKISELTCENREICVEIESMEDSISTAYSFIEDALEQLGEINSDNINEKKQLIKEMLEDAKETLS